jgi:bifunctional non-homologous end joining protein LigD
MRARVAAAGREPLPFMPFMLPTLVDEPPAAEGWTHEIKYDGYRTQVVIDRGTVRIFTRNGHDWTDRYWPVAQEALKLGATTAVIDGEMIVAGADAKPDFAALPDAIRTAPERLTFVAFDLLWWNGRELRAQPLSYRRRQLWRLVEPAQGRIQFSQAHEGDGDGFFAAVDAMGLEGIVSKRTDSVYLAGRVKSWVKVKAVMVSELDVIGVESEPGKPPVALMADGKKYVGAAVVGLTAKMRERLWSRVQEGRPVKGANKPKAVAVRPGLVGRVRHLKGEDKLRHAVLQAIELRKKETSDW